ncbi:MAG: single-stranded-DNA-specific exonuclease RecJ [Woeseiaceae bacterium]|nr:single-stranded-DNA-specific exonuclease RecJ [Woeseiaceae bacterium]|tara:strand:- start:5011 stop:6720 length:1710 start_codon:yes stop_codon:yes gene_type:complete
MRQKNPIIYERKYNDSNLLGEIDPLIARILSARGVNNKEEYNYQLRALAPVSSLENLDNAIKIIQKYKDENILIIGDYDVDGATSIALLMRCLGDYGFKKINYIVPNRFDYGYGLTLEVVEQAKTYNPKLLITVDNGISSIEGVDKARQFGIDVLVTDHHLPGPDLPNANVIVNPNIKNSKFISKNLAGVGVAFYLMAALGRELEIKGQVGAAKVSTRYLDLVALGTIADVVKLDFNNRVLVKEGLKRIQNKLCVPGILALIKESGKDYNKLTSMDLGFSLGPKINAAGRLEDISIGIECLLTDDNSIALKCAIALGEKNKKRQDIEQQMQREAYAYIERFTETNLPLCLCIYDKKWHQGIVGLVASRLKDHCNRPVIAFAEESKGILKGSARSIPGLHIKDLLESIATENPQLIEKFGGHSMAAGLTIKEKYFDKFKTHASAHIKKLYPTIDFTGAIYVDGQIPYQKLTIEFARMIESYGPWGAGFDEPIFHGKFHLLEQRVVGNNHLKMRVKSIGSEVSIDAIAFNQVSIVARDAVELIYKLQVNEFRGKASAQLLVENIFINEYYD